MVIARAAPMVQARRMKRRLFVWVPTGVALLIAGFVVYGWTTRRDPISYSKGGSFGTPAASPSVTTTTTRFIYEATGKEEAKLGALPGCSWDVPKVTATLKVTGDEMVLDQEIGTRVERVIHRRGAEGISLTYSASTVTCFGVRTTSEDTITPSVLRFKLPPRVGDTWRTHGVTEHHTEDATITVTGRDRITVPAGTYDVYIVQLKARLTGEQTGTVETTYWFEPALGIWVKERFATNVKQGAATFTSRFTAELSKIVR